MHLRAMNASTERLFRMLEALGHGSRFRIVLALCDRERHVSDLALEIGLSQSCTTRHLQALERAHVIRTHREGKRVLAALALERPEVAQVARWLRDAGAPAAYAAALPEAAPARLAGSGPAGRRPTPQHPAPGAPAAAARDADPTRIEGRSSDTSPADPSAHRPNSSVRTTDLDDFLL
jgi:DNA-binding transcriptional ArsR family regulator